MKYLLIDHDRIVKILNTLRASKELCDTLAHLDPPPPTPPDPTNILHHIQFDLEAVNLGNAIEWLELQELRSQATILYELTADVAEAAEAAEAAKAATAPAEAPSQRKAT